MRRKIFKSKDVDIVPGEMSNIDVSLISLVRKGANKQKIQIYKADEELEDSGEPTSESFFKLLKDFFGGAERIKKGDAEAVSATTDQKTAIPSVKNFKAMMAVKDITENMWRVNDTLSAVLRDILNNPAAADKKALMEQAIDQYAEYMKGKISSVKIEKSDPFFDTDIEKAGKVISSGNLEKIKTVHGILGELIASTSPESKDPGDEGDGQQGNDRRTQLNKEPECDPKKKEDKNLKKSEIADIVNAAVSEAVKPYAEKIAKMEGAETDTQQDETDIEKDDLAAMVADAVSSAMKPLADRMSKIEKSRGIGNSQLDQESGSRTVEKSDSTFNNFFVGEEV